MGCMINASYKLIYIESLATQESFILSANSVNDVLPKELPTKEKIVISYSIGRAF